MRSLAYCFVELIKLLLNQIEKSLCYYEVLETRQLCDEEAMIDVKRLRPLIRSVSPPRSKIEKITISTTWFSKKYCYF